MSRSLCLTLAAAIVNGGVLASDENLICNGVGDIGAPSQIGASNWSEGFSSNTFQVFSSNIYRAPRVLKTDSHRLKVFRLHPNSNLCTMSPTLSLLGVLAGIRNFDTHPAQKLHTKGGPFWKLTLTSVGSRYHYAEPDALLHSQSQQRR